MRESDKQTGGCHCGAVRFELNRSGVVSAHHCHCRDCQRSTGSSMATFVAVPDPHFKMLQGEVKGHTVTGESGGQVTRSFCPQCGSPVYSEVTIMPGVKFVKAGVLDDSSWVSPVSSFWTSSAQPWGHVDTSIPGFEKNPAGP